MKVLQLINSLDIGGAERLIVDSVAIYQKAGLEVDFLLLKDEPTFFREQLEEKITGRVVGLTKRSIYNPLLTFKLIRYLRQYDVVHAHLFPTLYWAVLAKWLSFCKVRLVYTEHNTSNRRREHFLLKYIDKLIYRGVDAVGCVSLPTYNNLQRYLRGKVNAQTIENGIELSDFKLDKKLPNAFKGFVNDSDFVLIQASRFAEQKDQQTLIKSLLHLPPTVKLLLAGEGPLRLEKQQLVERLGLQQRVKFLGNRHDIPQLLSAVDVAVLSSHYEGLPLTAVEGMAAGKPVIASRVEGLRDIVDGYGILFEQGNDVELAEKVTELMEDKNYYQQIATQCLNRAQDFNIEKMVARYVELYQALCDKR